MVLYTNGEGGCLHGMISGDTDPRGNTLKSSIYLPSTELVTYFPYSFRRSSLTENCDLGRGAHSATTSYLVSLCYISISREQGQ
jgi:hypothetical protein